MVHVTQVAELVEDDVVPEMFREEVEADIEIYVPLCRTGAPVGLALHSPEYGVDFSLGLLEKEFTCGKWD